MANIDMILPLRRVLSSSILVTLILALILASSVKAKPMLANSKLVLSLPPESMSDGQLEFDAKSKATALAVSESSSSVQDLANKCLELMAEYSFNQRWAEFEQRIRSIHPLYNEEIMNQLREKERDLYINSVEQLEPLERLMSLQNSMSKVDKDTL